jgi:hypothetical protein
MDFLSESERLVLVASTVFCCLIKETLIVVGLCGEILREFDLWYSQGTTGTLEAGMTG